MRLNCTVISIEWDEGTGGWTVETSDGPVRARVVVAGLGPLAEPKTPQLEGLDAFEGETFHSARWNHDYDLTGKRVAAVGTGASAIQFVPEIQKAGRAGARDPAHRAVDHAAPEPGDPRGGKRGSTRAFPPLQKLVRGAAYASASCWCSGS